MEPNVSWSLHFFTEAINTQLNELNQCYSPLNMLRIAWVGLNQGFGNLKNSKSHLVVFPQKKTQ